ncbi:MAG: hypothetical protein ACI9XP_001553 [Lentimonas sp.]|jgi:hypothetical protein
MTKLLTYTVFLFALGTFMATESVLAQSNSRLKSFQVHVGLPVSIQNESFKGVMQGLVTTSMHYQYTLKSGLSFGLGGNYTYFTINNFKINEPILGGIQMPSGFFKLGYEKFYSQTFGIDIGIKGGYGLNIIKSEVGKSNDLRTINSQSQGAYMEPMASVILVGEESDAFKFHIGYVFNEFAFRPSRLGLISEQGFPEDSFGTSNQYLTVGFAYVHYFN